MNILLVHNYYQHAGGEGLVFKAEADLLVQHGHTVLKYTLHNDQIEPSNPLTTAANMIWNRQVYQKITDLVKRNNIEIVHCHNTFPLISPSVYRAAKDAGAAVVQTLHNYRLLCPNALFLRDEKPCEDCLGKSLPWPGILHKCYRNSRVDSGGVAAYLFTHRLRKTWSRDVDAYIALTNFAKEKFIQGGIPPHKIILKPNFIDPDPDFQLQTGKYALFVGRLSIEKGINTLLSAWRELGQTLPLKIIGDGPQANEVALAAKENPAIEWLGYQPADIVYEQMKAARFLIFPSHWYEGLPRTIIESLAVGTPVIASDIGSMKSLITPNVSGWHFQAKNPSSLAQVVSQCLQNPNATIRKTARQTFETHYSAEQNYRLLLSIYQRVSCHARSQRSSLAPSLR